MASSLIPGCQVMSDLLTIREKGVISTLLQPQHELIKSTVAQVLVAKENQDGGPGWSCLDCGVVCLIEDQSVHSYFLHLYCVKSHQAGFNFANEAEAEEFHLAVKAVQRKQEKMKGMIQMTNIDKKDNSTCDLAAPGVKPADAPSTTVTPTAISDLDPTMRKLLMRAQLTKEDLKDKDIAEAVDCIINQFGGLKAVQRELRSRGPASQTLPKGARVSLSLALKKGPLPPPPIKSSTTFQQTPQGTDTQDQSPLAAWIPPPKSAPPPVPERIRKSASFKYVGSPTASGRSEQILSALREVFKQKQLLQRSSREEGNQMEPDSNKEEQR
ncbi:neural Wiskott-Aldrich syndrome protein isoform X2 [Thunnus maccoyii]|uniref:neural Wiskott-Aldrich syndrome protein isoform X2 n=1 Tax=Thunnus maccoyii TaxID=8240 RepID=UPI001C4B1490|nr:neural Wiskott-Aldrich syndrome protein isoform X2 [Thunnus maccoyii]